MNWLWFRKGCCIVGLTRCQCAMSQVTKELAVDILGQQLWMTKYILILTGRPCVGDLFEKGL